MGDEDKSQAWKEAAVATRHTRQYVCDQMRMMADARGEYAHLAIASPFIRSLWRAAAELLAEQPWH